MQKDQVIENDYYFNQMWGNRFLCRILKNVTEVLSYLKEEPPPNKWYT